MKITSPLLITSVARVFISKLLPTAVAILLLSYNSNAGTRPASKLRRHSNMGAVPVFSYPGTHNYLAGVAVAAFTPTSINVGASGFNSPAVVGAGFNAPEAVATDAAGNVYVADTKNGMIKKITINTNATTMLVSGLSGPTGVAVDAAGTVYFTDNGNDAVKKLPLGGTPVAIGTGFSTPHGVAVDASGNVYVADRGNNLVKKIVSATGATVVIGGTNFSTPYSVAVDSVGNVFVVDHGHGVVKKIPADGSAPVTIGSGFNGIEGIAVDGSGNVYVGDYGSSALKEVPGGTGTPIVLGSGFSNPGGVAVDGAGNIYLTDVNSVKVLKPAGGYYIAPFLPAGLKFDGSTGAISGTPTVVSPLINYTITAYNSFGAGTATLSLQVKPLSISYNPPPVLKQGTAIAPISPVSANVATAAYSKVLVNRITGMGSPRGLCIDASGNIYVADYGNGAVKEFPASGGAPITIGTGFAGPTGVAVDSAGNVYVADYNHNAVKKVPVGNGTPVTLASGIGGVEGLTADAQGDVFYTDFNAGKVIKIPFGGGASVQIGTGFVNPSGVAVDAAGNVFVSDFGSSLITKVPFDGSPQVNLGSGFHNPYGLTVDASGNIFVADYSHDAVTEIPAAGGPPIALNSSFMVVTGVAVDPAGNVIVTDYNNNNVTEIKPVGGYYINAHLPLGLTFDNTTGTITGTPTAVVPLTTYTVTAYNAFGRGTATIDISTDVGAVPALSYTTPHVYPAGAAISPLTPSGSGVSSFGYSVTPIVVGPAFGTPFGVAVDKAGNVYVADAQTSSIKKLPAGGGAATSVGTGFANPIGVAVDAAGNVFVADAAHHAIKKILASDGSTITINATFNTPEGVAVDAAGNIFVADIAGTVTKIPVGGGPIITLAAGLNFPNNVAVDASGNVYVSELTAVVMLPVGGGAPVPIASGFSSPFGLALDAAGNLFVGDSGTNLVKMVLAGSNITIPIGGTNFSNPNGLAIDSSGNIYVSDLSNKVLKKIKPLGGYFLNSFLPKGLKFSTFTGVISGTPFVASPATNYTITAYNGYGSTSAVTNIQVTAPTLSYAGPYTYTAGNAITPVTPTSTGIAPAAYSTALLGVGTGFATPRAVAADAAGNVYIADFTGNKVYKLPAGGGSQVVWGSGFSNPDGLAVDAAGNVYVSDYGNNAIKKIPAGGGTPTVFAPGISNPYGIAVDAAGNVYVADHVGATIKKIPAGGGTPVNMGSGFAGPLGVAVDALGNVYVGDSGSGPIKKIPAGGGAVVSLGSGFNYPYAVAVDASGNVFVGDNTGTIKEIPSDGGSTISLNTSFALPTGAAVDGSGNVYIADYNNGFVKEIKPVGGYYLGTPLPAGFAFSNATGVISGKPTAAAASSSYVVTGYSSTIGVQATINITVNLPFVVYGTPDFDPAPFARSITYTSSNPAVATIVANKVHIVSVGVTTITGKTPAGTLSQAIMVTKATLTVTGNSTFSIQGLPIPPLLAVCSGFVYNDTQNGLTTQPTASTPATSSSPAGNYPVVPSGGSSNNYNFTYVNGNITIVPTSFVTSPIPTKTYGDADFLEFGQNVPGISYVSSNPGVASVGNNFIHITGAGTSTITASNGSHSINKTLTVNKAPLTVTADNQSITQGQAIPAFTLTYSGFVNGDTKAVLVQPTVSTTAGNTSPAGNYPITLSGGFAKNYVFTFMPGILTINSLAGGSITLNDDELLAPKVSAALSPNGDGINDVLSIKNIEAYPQNKLVVLNSKGVRVFEVSGYDNQSKAFNGYSNLTQNRQPAGVYYYLLQYSSGGVVKSKSGYFEMKY